MIYLLADPHFFHDKILEYCKRPFKDLEEMHKTLIDNFNRVVQPEDTVYWLGDVGFASPSKLKNILAQLKGKHLLIRGNHDKHGNSTYYNIGFAAVLESAEIRIGQKRITMAHYPRRSLKDFLCVTTRLILKMLSRKRKWIHVKQIIKREWKQYDAHMGDWHLNGHVHDSWSKRGRNINVGVDVHNFTPVSLKTITQIIDKQSYVSAKQK